MSYSSRILEVALLSVVAILASAHTSYNSDKQICCNGTVTDKGDMEVAYCCGTTVYDYSKSVCCGDDEIYNRNDVNSTNEICCYDKKFQVTKLYNYMTQECCDGNVITKPNPEAYYSCCNDQLYTYSSHMCCNGQIMAKDDDKLCCGEEAVYDSSKQTCCEMYGSNKEGTYGVLDYEISDIMSNTTACCGLTQYDYSIDLCCDGTVLPKKSAIGEDTFGSCCGDETYDTTTQMCCSKWGQVATNKEGYIAHALHDINTDDAVACCGTSTYNYNDEICCDDETVISKPEGSNKDEWMSCCGGEALTNYTTQMCVKGKIIPRKDNYYDCGEDTYNTLTQICCGNLVYDSEPNTACCYGAEVMYDTTTEKCCYDTVEQLTDDDKSANNDACCAVVYYNGQDEFIANKTSEEESEEVDEE